MKSGPVSVSEHSCQNKNMLIRPATNEDTNAIWAIMEPIIRAGETYTLPREMDKESALAYWLSSGHEVFVAEAQCEIVGTYFLQERVGPK
jgi:L-amino acid N-acyltransferase YncA